MNRNYDNERSCNRELARCYVPIQVMSEVFSSREALRKGTLFPELYRPYFPSDKGERRGNIMDREQMNLLVEIMEENFVV